MIFLRGGFLYLLFSFSTKLWAAPVLPHCSMQFLCDRMKGNSLLPSAFAAEVHSDEDPEDLENIFAENQRGVLELLTRKKSDIPEAEFEKLEKAIATVTLGSFRESAIKNIFPTACNRPNAIYIPKMHRIFVCPSLLKYPRGTLKQIIAHELGHVVQKMQNFVPCFKDYPTSQVDEVFADWVSSKILSNKIAEEKDPELAGKKAFESQLLFLNLACQFPTETNSERNRTHPKLKNRIEQIFLAQPAFQVALRCQSSDTKFCD